MIILTFARWDHGSGISGANHSRGPGWWNHCAVFDTEESAREWINDSGNQFRLKDVAIFHPVDEFDHQHDQPHGGAFYDKRNLEDGKQSV